MGVVIYNNNKYTVDPLYQWDLNQVLEIHGLTLESILETHITSSSMSFAIVTTPTVDAAGIIKVKIPNSLLQKSEPITVLICEVSGDVFKTTYKIDVPVKPRKRPADYSIDLSDDEVYSFNAMNRRLTVIEEKLSDANTFVDVVKPLIYANTNLANEALSIAKGKNQARAFATTETMYEWLSNPNNKGLCSIGDNLYIVDIDVPDWWISEVLTAPDPNTGYYYKIAQLETDKVDIRNLYSMIADLQSDILWINPTPDEEFLPQTINVDTSKYKSITVICKNGAIYYEYNCHEKGLYRIHSGARSVIDFRPFTITETGIEFADGYSQESKANDSMIPYKIIGNNI